MSPTFHRPTPRRHAMALLVFATTLAACAPASRAATDTRTLGPFDTIVLSGSMDLQVRQGATSTVVVDAEASALPQIETTVESGQLRIKFKREHWWSNAPAIRLAVVTPRLKKVSSAGSGHIVIQTLQTPSLSVSLAGSGTVMLDAVKADTISIETSGSSDVNGHGSARQIAINLAGSSRVVLPELHADDVSVSIAGSGDVAVNAKKTLKVDIAGSGDVVYSGEPTITRSVAGSGRIRKR